MSFSYTEIFFAGCILVLPFLYDSSHTFRYYLKFFIYYAVVMINSVILIPVFTLRPGNVRNLLYASAWCHHISTLLGLRWILRGREHLEADRACIIVSNHQSSLDILGMFDIWPVMDKCTVVAKRELMYAGPFGLAAWLCGLIFIPRMETDKARKIVNEAAENIKQTKTKLWVFPEGTRRNTGEIHPFKKGAFHMAISSHLPILPVVFTQYYFLDKANRRLDNGTILITALPPISTEHMTSDHIDQLIETTRSLMTTTFNDTNREQRQMMWRDFPAKLTTANSFQN